MKEAAARQYVCRAYAVRDHALLFINVDAGLDPMRGDSRFADLARKIWPESA